MTESPETEKYSATARYIEVSAQDLDICLEYTESREAFDAKYHKGDKLGGGGFGCVYRGVRASDFKQVVIKEIETKRVPCWCRIDGLVVPLEVILLTKVNKYPGIVKQLEVFKMDDDWAIVMPGNSDMVCDLFDYICERGTLGEAETAFLMYQLVGILLYCHHAGVIHRDLKDENLLIDRRTKEIQLIDFGSGAFLHEGLYTDFDGTRVYCPPEWINNNAYFAKPAEVWSLGVLLFDMLNGDVPFVNDKGITSGDLRFRRDGLTRDSIDLMYACLNRDMDRRISLSDVLKHPWMRRHQHVVSKQAPAAAQFAVAQATILMTAAPNCLINGKTRILEQSNPAPTSYGITINNNGVSAHRQSQLSTATSKAQNSGASEILRTSSNGSYASSGYFTRSNSLSWEEELRRLESLPLFPQPSELSGWLYQWRGGSPATVSSGKNSGSSTCQNQQASPSRDCSNLPLDAHESSQFEDPTDFFDGITITPRSTYSPSFPPDNLEQ